jgi:hypothetical protein
MHERSLLSRKGLCEESLWPCGVIGSPGGTPGCLADALEQNVRSFVASEDQNLGDIEAPLAAQFTVTPQRTGSKKQS